MDRTKWPGKANLLIARPGIVYICIAFFFTLLLFLIKWNFIAWFALFASFFICWFFRDPDRNISDDKNALVSPADGKVIISEKINKNDYIENSCIKISIFMNVFNVHVNRIPFSGIIEKTIYYPGKFFNASFDKASKDNEKNALIIRTNSGKRYALVQIAGLIARRIISRVKQGDKIKCGERYGMICFGSRLDIYVPEDTEILVEIGEKVKAGSSIIGYLKP